MKLVLLALISFITTYFITPQVIKIARRYNCIDNPGARRFHKKATPRWGGAAFFIGMLPFVAFLELDRAIISYLVVSIFLMAIGMIDDLRQLGWKSKMGAILAATTVVIFSGDVLISHIGAYDQIGRIELGMFSIPFTYFCIVGVTNAINLIDGLNGLAAGTSLLAFLFIGLAAIITGNEAVAVVSIAFVGALGGFIRYNFSKAKIFMGDSGSLFLGFSLGVFSVLLTQNDSRPVDPMFPVLVLLLPIFDTLRVMFIRIFSFKNPFKADKTHLHHLIVRRKFSSSSAVVVLWFLTLIFGTIALLFIRKSSTPYLITVLCASLLLSFFADTLPRRR